MPRCGTCGKVNRDGAVFCQDCGVRLPIDHTGGNDDVPKTRVVQASDRAAAAALAPQAAAASGPAIAPATIPCGSCGAQNPIGMNFCKMCGGKLGVSINPAQPTPSAQVAKTACPSCGGLTPASYQFCQHCGVRMAEAMQRAGSNPQAIAATVAVPPTPPAGMRAVQQPQVQNFSKPEPVARVVSTPIPPTGAGTRPRGGIPTAQAAPLNLGRARIVSLRPDGTDASSVIFEGEALDLGRSEGSLKFESDPYLAARHVRIERRDRSYFLYPLDFVNGVYVRIREPQELVDFDSFLCGRQLLRFEVPLDAERDARPAIEHGVAVFGSPLRPAWGRLRQLTVAALSLDVYYLTRPEIVIGREEGNIRFLDDEHMSRKHAALSDQRGRILLEDLGSSNGTYLRVRQPRELRSGDLIRMGDQLLRFEL